MLYPIVKGQGVTWDDEEGRYMMSFPDPNGMTADGISHAEVNPFFLHPKTGELLDQNKFPHRWPMEGLAHSAALDVMRKFPQLNYAQALGWVKQKLNQSVIDFNKEMDQKGDSTHRLPLYFDDYGNLNADWARINYGSYQPKATPTHERQTKNADGVVTFHTNSHSVLINGQDMGYFPESGAFPTWEFFKKYIDAAEIPTNTVTKPHVDPQEMVIGSKGERGPVRRHLKTWAAPMGEYGMTQAEKGGRDMLHVDQAIAGLDPAFFIDRDQRLEPKAEQERLSNLQSAGLTAEESQAVSRSAVGSFFNRDSAKSGTSGINNVLTQLTQNIMAQTQLSAEDVRLMAQKYVRGYQAQGMEERGIHHDNAAALIEALAMSEVARQTSSNTGHVPTYSRQALSRLSGGVEMPQLIPRDAPSRDMDFSHIRGEQEVPPYLPIQPALMESPTVGSGRSEGEAYGSDTRDVRTSADNISQLMEHLQMADAQMDMGIMKAVSVISAPDDLSKAYDLSLNDINLIKSARGDWERLAKTLMVAPHVVKVVKLSLR
jgi:hypothetical protein